MTKPTLFQSGLAILLLAVLGQGFLVVHRTGQVAELLDRRAGGVVTIGQIRSSWTSREGILLEVTTERFPGESQEAWIQRHWSDWEALLSHGR